MELGVTLIILIVVIASIWLFVEFKRLKHKLFAIFIIALIIFSYMSASVVFKGKDINLKSISGIMEGSGLYLAWLGNIGKNLITITGNVIKMDWTKTGNSTSSKI